MDRATAAYLDLVANEWNRSKDPGTRDLWFRLVDLASENPSLASVKVQQFSRKRISDITPSDLPRPVEKY